MEEKKGKMKVKIEQREKFVEKVANCVEEVENVANCVEQAEQAEKDIESKLTQSKSTGSVEKPNPTKAELAEKERKRKETERFKKRYFEFYDDVKISHREDW